MAITIISQSLCLRSNFIITKHDCSGSKAQSQIMAGNPKPQAPTSNEISSSEIQTTGDSMIWDFITWNSFKIWTLGLGISAKERPLYLGSIPMPHADVFEWSARYPHQFASPFGRVILSG